MTEESGERREVSGATVARLPDYLHVLTRLAEQGITQVSSSELASAVGVTPAQLRKDVSQLGSYGVRGVGYDTEHLAGRIAVALGLTRPWPIVIVGIGRLGQALAHYPGLAERGLDVAALFDIDPALIGSTIGDLPIHDMADLPRVVAELAPVIAVIATPASAAADVCARLADAGVTAVLNFAPDVLAAPPGIHLRQVDVAHELQILAYHAQGAQASPAVGTLPGAPGPREESAQPPAEVSL